MLRQISASAGSGKTYALTRHFLSLLQGADQNCLSSCCTLASINDASGSTATYGLPEILAATFTNKAAAEMKERIIKALKTEALEAYISRQPGSLQRYSSPQEAWLAEIFRHYSLLNLRTIDSLLSLLVRLSALELGLAPDFQPSFNAEEYFTPVYDGLMEDLSLWRQGYGVKFFTNDGDTLYQALTKACETLIHVTDITGYSHKKRLHLSLLELVHRIFRELPLPETDVSCLYKRLQQLRTDFTSAAAILSRRITDEELAVSANFLKFLANNETLLLFKVPSHSVLITKSSFDDCLNKKSKGTASEAANNAYATLAQCYHVYVQELPLIKDALSLAYLIPLAHELHARCMDRVRQTGVLPALLLPVYARTILSGEFGVSDTLCRMGTRLTHMLLDEFQDTSTDQWQAIMPLALECLSRGGSITYVGDVKQAIYGWRGGEAGLFDGTLEEPELLAVAPTPSRHKLPYNWRSSKAIIDHNNAFFSLLGDTIIAYEVLAAMLPRDTPNKYITQGAITVSGVYANAIQILPEERQPELCCGHVALYTIEASSSTSLEQLVHEQLKSLFTKKFSEHYSCADIAVLVRSSEEERLIASWLTQWGIPVVTENSFLLTTYPLVSRLISFLTFIDYPYDDMAFWEFISGSECFGTTTGINEYDFYQWISSLGDRKKTPLFQFFRNDYPALWTQYIEPFYNQAGLMSAYDMLMETMRLYDLLQGEAAPYLKRMLEVAHLAESRGMSSLAAFLAFWKEAGDKEKLPLPESMNAVRLMTIHKAKGLEFPVVIIPFHHRGNRRDPDLVQTNIANNTILTRAGKEIPEVYYPACITDELERLNLLYVAWTRPVKELHAFITRPSSTSTPLMKGIGVLLQHYRQRYPNVCQFVEITPPPIEVDDILYDNTSLSEEYLVNYDASQLSFTGIDATQKTMELKRKQAIPDTLENAVTFAQAPHRAPQKVWHPMNWLPRLKIYRSNLEELSFSSRQRGIFAHLCLELLYLTGNTKADVERAITHALHKYPAPMDSPDDPATQVRESLLWFACLPEAKSWLEYGLREQGIIDEHGATHRVDLLVMNDDQLHAIDYKTGTDNEQTHTTQVRRYMRLASAALGIPCRGTLIYLDSHQIIEITP